ncbi:MAG: alpha/beta fold hydrolase [Solidesulfovibrio sp. DCME]|uniref:alpha/beta fold hydrolase n=1 Tax=Solidesulfovibrio sp. DCME TaxID=3447380 RepID=UPI003D1288E5
MTHQPQTIRVNGIDMSVVIAGQGPDVLLLHGFPDTHAVWREQIPALVAAGYRVIAPDTRGCGQTAMPGHPSAYAMEHLVADATGLLDALGSRTVRLAGHDWGAIIGWQLCMRHPQRIDRFAALSVGHPAAYARGGFLQKCKGHYILLLQLPGLAEYLVTCRDWFLFRLLTHYPGEFPRWRANLSRPGRLTAGANYYRANCGLLLRPRTWPPVTTSVLGLWSDGDRFLVERQMTGSQRYVAGPWRYERITGASHWLQLDAPQKVNSLLLDFFR